MTMAQSEIGFSGGVLFSNPIILYTTGVLDLSQLSLSDS